MVPVEPATFPKPTRSLIATLRATLVRDDAELARRQFVFRYVHVDPWRLLAPA